MSEIDLMRKIEALEKRIKALETHEFLMPANNIRLGNYNVYGTTPANIDDDSAISFTPANSVGVIFVWRRYTSITSWGLVYYRATNDASNAAVILTGGATLEATTGVLAGTTGTDARVTVSAHTDGKIYIENRLGGAISIHYVLFGA